MSDDDLLCPSAQPDQPGARVFGVQTATGDNAIYDKGQSKIWLTGHVALSSDGNVTKGDRLIYDLASGQATIESDRKSKNERVKGVFLPGSAEPGASIARISPRE